MNAVANSGGLELELFLRRIDYRGGLEPGLDTLAGLQLQFLYHVPFENLDIHLGRRVTLSLPETYTKIVERGRGGFCYECNHLFYAVLARLGFRVTLHGARMLTEGSMPLDRGHMVLAVELEHTWLVDVGNGRSCREPLRLDGGGSACSEGIDYRVRPYQDGYALFCRDADSDWAPRYRFGVEPLPAEAFEQPCRLQQTAPESRFTRHRLASLALPDGRVTLLDAELTRQRDGRSEVGLIGDAGAYGRALAGHFGIHLPDDSVQALFDGIPQSLPRT